MCFSAEMDIAAGFVVGAVEVDALRHVISLWCLWAATASVAFAVLLRSQHPDRSPPGNDRRAEPLTSEPTREHA